MPSKIAIIAIVGLTASAVCIGAGAAIGAREYGALDIPFFHSGPRCEATGATATSRDIAWDGSNRAGLAMNATINYAPGNDEKVHATGDPAILAHLRLDDGIIKLDCHGWDERDRDVTITLPGRKFEKFILTGTGKMNLNGLDQPQLDIKMAGVATITAHGKVENLSIDMAGVSKADFTEVAGRKTKLRMAGVNKADIAPSDEADIQIAGPSEVTLHSNPPKLDSRIMGPGRIRKVGPAT